MLLAISSPGKAGGISRRLINIIESSFPFQVVIWRLCHRLLSINWLLAISLPFQTCPIPQLREIHPLKERRWASNLWRRQHRSYPHSENTLPYPGPGWGMVPWHQRRCFGDKFGHVAARFIKHASHVIHVSSLDTLSKMDRFKVQDLIYGKQLEFIHWKAIWASVSVGTFYCLDQLCWPPQSTGSMWTSTKQEGKSPRPPCLGRMPNKTFEGLRVSTLFHNRQKVRPLKEFPGIACSAKLKSSETRLRLNHWMDRVRSTIWACGSPVPILSRYSCLHLEAPSARQSEDWRKRISLSNQNSDVNLCDKLATECGMTVEQKSKTWNARAHCGLNQVLFVKSRNYRNCQKQKLLDALSIAQ